MTKDDHYSLNVCSDINSHQPSPSPPPLPHRFWSVYKNCFIFNEPRILILQKTDKNLSLVSKYFYSVHPEIMILIWCYQVILPFSIDFFIFFHKAIDYNLLFLDIRLLWGINGRLSCKYRIAFKGGSCDSRQSIPK